MSALLSIWWVWLGIALIVGIAEVLLPGFIFLGFAFGALAMAVIVALVPGLSTPVMLALFAGLSLVAWIVMRRVFKLQSGSAKIFTHDINED